MEKRVELVDERFVPFRGIYAFSMAARAGIRVRGELAPKEPKISFFIHNNFLSKIKSGRSLVFAKAQTQVGLLPVSAFARAATAPCR